MEYEGKEKRVRLGQRDRLPRGEVDSSSMEQGQMGVVELYVESVTGEGEGKRRKRKRVSEVIEVVPTFASSLLGWDLNTLCREGTCGRMEGREGEGKLSRTRALG